MSNIHADAKKVKEEILASAATPAAPSPPNPPALLFLDRLAAAKRLPVEFLRQLGIRPNGKRQIVIPYMDQAGNLLANRSRIDSEDPKERFRWAAGSHVMPYGLWRVDRCQCHGYAIIPEGESDCWTIWYHELPAIGIPGASTTRCLERSHLEGIDRLYIHQEPGQAAENYIRDMKARLVTIGFKGQAFVFSCPDGLKDPSDLHIDDRERFVQRLTAVLDAAAPLSLTPPSRPGFRRLVKPDDPPEAALERDDDPHRLARLFLKRYLRLDGCTLRYYAAEFQRWVGVSYRKIEEKEMKAHLVKRTKAEFDEIATAQQTEREHQ